MDKSELPALGAQCPRHPDKYRLHTKGEVAQWRGTRLVKVDNLVINLLLANLIGQFKLVIVQVRFYCVTY